MLVSLSREAVRIVLANAPNPPARLIAATHGLDSDAPVNFECDLIEAVLLRDWIESYIDRQRTSAPGGLQALIRAANVLTAAIATGLA